jgi:hypothetical protein
MERKLRVLPRLTNWQARRTQGHRATLVDSLQAPLEALRRHFPPCPAKAVLISFLIVGVIPWIQMATQQHT